MKTFQLHGRELPYLDHAYNGTRINERAVEVPVGLSLLDTARAERRAVLEVGAVLPHYLPDWPEDGHTVIDLYEEYAGVIQADILTWRPDQMYDLILCISTLDHLNDSAEVCAAVQRMRSWLAPGGLLLVTLPYGQPPEVGGGPWLDALIASNALQADTVWRMDKVDTRHHQWMQVEQNIPPLAYHGASYFANTVYLLSFGPMATWWTYEPDC